RIDEHPADSHVGDELVDQAERFFAQAGRKKVYAGHIAAGAVEARDQAEFNRVDSVRKHDRYRTGHRLRGKGRSGRTCGEDDRRLAADQVDGERAEPIVLTVRPAVFDGDVFAFDIAGFFQAAPRGHAAAVARAKMNSRRPSWSAMSVPMPEVIKSTA